MPNTLKPKALFATTVGAASLAAIATSTPAAAQTTAPATDEATPISTTICRYDPNSGRPNPFGMRTFISVIESAGNTTFTLDSFPTFAVSPNNPDLRADVASERSLTLYGTALADARQIMTDDPFYYAQLLNVETSAITEGSTFSDVDATLACTTVTAQSPEEPTPEEPTPEEPTPETPAPETPAPETPAPETPIPEVPAPETSPEDGPNLAALPNGNYRVVSADFPNRIVTDAELVDAGGTLFLFRKSGNQITGTFSYIDSELSACVTGTLDGNQVTGEAIAAEFASLEADKESRFLGPGSFLELTSHLGEGRFERAVLDLEGFSQINSGTRLPVETCP
ncbi:MAG: hypothetical protein AAFR18_00905 [Cyanobacteria bacterium J06627_32]